MFFPMYNGALLELTHIICVYTFLDFTVSVVPFISLFLYPSPKSFSGLWQLFRRYSFYFSLWPLLLPVSYTHLDVYKRQVQKHASKECAIQVQRVRQARLRQHRRLLDAQHHAISRDTQTEFRTTSHLHANVG